MDAVVAGVSTHVRRAQASLADDRLAQCTGVDLQRNTDRAR
jgi:hypothetical protein